MASTIKADTLQSTTSNVFVLNSVGTEYARFNSSGNLGIGTTTQIGAEKIGISFDDSVFNGLGIQVQGSSSSAGYTIFRNSSGTSIGTITRNGTASSVKYNTTSSSATGAYLLDSGVAFPATQVSSADANTLDDYEEGTFTPTIIGTTTNPTVTYGRQDGRYVKIGMLVYASGSIVVNTISGGSGTLAFGGFPFTSRNTNEADRTAINISYVSGFSSTTIPTSGIFNGGTTFAEMLVFNSADARAGRTSYVNTPPAAGFNIYYTCCYCTTT